MIWKGFPPVAFYFGLLTLSRPYDGSTAIQNPSPSRPYDGSIVIQKMRISKNHNELVSVK